MNLNSKGEDKKMETCLTVELIIQRGRKVFMIRRQNTGYMDGYYAFVGGHVEKGESLKQAVIREVKEECAIDVKEENLEFVCGIRNGKRENYFNFYFKTEVFENEPQNMEKDKCDNIKWVEIDDIPENTVPNDKRALHNYFNGIKLDEYNF